MIKCLKCFPLNTRQNTHSPVASRHILKKLKRQAQRKTEYGAQVKLVSGTCLGLSTDARVTEHRKQAVKDSVCPDYCVAAPVAPSQSVLVRYSFAARNLSRVQWLVGSERDEQFRTHHRWAGMFANGFKPSAAYRSECHDMLPTQAAAFCCAPVSPVVGAVKCGVKEWAGVIAGHVLTDRISLKYVAKPLICSFSATYCFSSRCKANS